MRTLYRRVQATFALAAFALAVERTGLTSNALTTSGSTLNATNEISSGTEQVGSGGPTYGFEFVYDNAGNLLRQQVGATPTTRSSRVYTYDAWNRLTRLEFQKGTLSAWDGLRDPRAAYTYYAGHQLATRVADTLDNGSIVPTQRTHFYFDAEWRLLEERIDPGYAQGPSSPWDWSGPNFATAFDPARQTGRQYIWDPSGGPNELVQVRTAPTPGTLSFAGSLWAATDRNSSVIAWVGRASDTGAYDRVHYRAFGTPILQAVGDADGNGVTNFDDQLKVLANFNSVISPDGSATPGFSRVNLNQNGAVDFDDVLAVLANFGVTQKFGVIGGTAAAAGTGSGPVIGYAGAIWDPDAALCLMRYRWYDPGLGRFLSRDPAGYTDGSSLYLYALGNPLAYADPFGMQAFWSAENYKAGLAATGQIVQRIASNVVDQIGGVQSLANDAVSAAGVAVGAIDPAVFMSQSEVVGPIISAVQEQGVAGFAQDVAASAADAVVDIAAGVVRGDPDAIGDAVTAGAEFVIGTKGVGRIGKLADATEAGARTARHTIEEAVRVGKAGEDAAGIVGPKSRIRIPGTDRYRVPERITPTTITEVKNVRRLSYTQQLRDLVNAAEVTGRDFELFIRETTEVSGPLREAIEQGHIIPRCIPKP